MSGLLTTLTDMIFKVFIFCSKIILAVILPFLLMVVFYLIYYYCKGRRFKKSKFDKTKKKYTKKGILHNLYELFVHFPQRFVLDLYLRNPDEFREYGLHFFCGEQGSGKSIATVHFIKMLKERYPGLQIRSNISLNFQDGTIESPDDLFKENGKLGQVNFIDEIQNWFNSLESKNMSPEVCAEICQQRKEKRILIGTSQVFYRMAKQLREQCTLLYEPMTILGCLTIVRVYKPKIDEDGAVNKKLFRRMYFFVHDKELRKSYDTYEKVKRLMEKGYKPRSEQLGEQPIMLITSANDKQ